MTTQVAVHSSQFPGQLRRDLYESLRKRQVNHKFHYDSVRAVQKWLELHQVYSPSRSDPECRLIYERSFEAACGPLQGQSAHLIGLGCGGGQKDTRLLELLKRTGAKLSYTPIDASVGLVLVAWQAALSVIPERKCRPLVCDLASAEDLPEVVDNLCDPDEVRVFTFFGMIPNFVPDLILPRLARLVCPKDILLFSANLTSESDYTAGLQEVLPQYDNVLTRDWLMSFLIDCGVEPRDGELRFCVEQDPGGRCLKRIAVYFTFSTPRELRIDQERFRFEAGESIRLFFSYRHTAERLRHLLSAHGLTIAAQWVTASAQEGVFLVSKTAPNVPT